MLTTLRTFLFFLMLSQWLSQYVFAKAGVETAPADFSVTATQLYVEQGAPLQSYTVAAISGNTGSLTVTIDGSLSATKNGITIRNIQLENTVIIADIQATCGIQPASFTLAVSDGQQTVSTELTVSPASFIALQIVTDLPPATTVNEGSPVSAGIQIRAGGNAPPVYTWYKNGREQRLLRGPSLEIPSAQESDAGAYYVVVTRGCTSLTSTVFNLSVIAGPYIRVTATEPIQLLIKENESRVDVQIGTLTTNTGQAGDLTVTINGSTSASVNGVQVTNLKNRGGLVYADLTAACGATSPLLTLAATNGTLTGTNTVRIGVISVVPPLLSLPVQATQVISGETVSIPLTFTANTSYGIQWYRDNVPLSGQTSATLTLPNIQTSMAGNYRAVLSDACSSFTSATVSLSVLQRLTLRSTANPADLFVGQSTLITAQIAGGIPPYRFTFQRSDTGDRQATETNTLIYTDLPLGTHTINISVTDQSNQRAETTLQLIVREEQPNGPVCDAFITRTTDYGLGSNQLVDVLWDAGTVYAATPGGLAISKNDGRSFANLTTANKLSLTNITRLATAQHKLYAGTSDGLLIGNTPSEFVRKTTGNGLPSAFINDIAFSDNRLFVATGKGQSDGGLAVSDNGGESFTSLKLPGGYRSVSRVYCTGQKVYILSAEKLFVSTDNGQTWSPLLIKLKDQSLIDPAIFCLSGYRQTLYLGTRSGLYRSTDSGATFALLTTSNGLGSNYVNEITVQNQTVYASTSEGLSISADGGLSFVTRNSRHGLKNNIAGRVAVSPTGIYICTGNGLSACEPDIAAPSCPDFVNHPVESGPNDPEVRSVAMPGNSLYAATANGLAVSQDRGQTFTMLLTRQNITKIRTDGTGLFVGTTTGLIIYRPGAKTEFITRTTANGLPDNQILDVYYTDNTLYCATQRGLAVSTDNGDSFSVLPDTKELMVLSVWIQSNRIFICTNNGLLISDDSGQTFTARTLTGIQQNSVKAVAAIRNRVYVVTTESLAVSTDGGRTFTFQAKQVNKVYVYKNIVYLMGSDGLSLSEDGGINFYTSITNQGAVNDIAIANSDLFVATNNGVASCNALVLSDGPTCTDFFQQAMGNIKVNSLYKQGRLYSIATPNGAFVSTDNGQNFRQITTADGLPSNNVRKLLLNDLTFYAATNEGLYIKPLNEGTTSDKGFLQTKINGLPSNVINDLAFVGQTLVAATGEAENNGGLVYSVDGGKTFIPFVLSSSPLNVKAFYADGVNFYAVTSAGLFISRNSGLTWTFPENYQTSIINTSPEKNVIPVNKYQNDVCALANKVIIATDYGLFLSTNNGATFTRKTTADGLGSNAVSSVHIRGNTIYAGTQAGLSISTDGGNTFVNRIITQLAQTNQINDITTDEVSIYVATNNKAFSCFDIKAFPPVPPASTAPLLTVTADAPENRFIAGAPFTLTPFIAGGTPPYSISFDGPGTITTNDNVATITGLPAGVYIYTVTVTDAQTPVPRTSTQLIQITVGSPSPFAISPVTVCAGAPASLSAIGCQGGTIQWQDGSIGLTYLTPAVTQTTVISATCTLTDQTIPASGTATARPRPQAIISRMVTDESRCPVSLSVAGTGTTFVVTGPNGYVFSHIFRTGTAYTLPELKISKAGTYTLTVNYSNECGQSDPVSGSLSVSRSCP